MHLLEALDLGKDFGGDPLFSSLCLSLDPGEKVGLVGPNGTGKTSLLRILTNLDDDFRGRIKKAPGCRIALVPQRWEPPVSLSCAESLLVEARALEARLETVGEALAILTDGALAAALELYGELRARYELLGAEEAFDRAARLLERIGLGDSADRPAQVLSGGEKNVLALGVALMEDPDLLILDEPGNHLDFAGLAWLEDYIGSERRAILVVSHNRRLLDRSVERILELDGGRLEAYTGGYSAYRLEKLKRAAGQGKDWQADRKRIERLEALVARFAQIARSRPDPAWGKRLRARRSQLERERSQAAERPDLDRSRMRIDFEAAQTKADFALVVRGYSKAFGERSLFSDASFDLLAGERAVMIGPNGSGKTSFLRDLVAAEGSLDGGPIRVGPSMRIGYCAQEQEVFKVERTIEEEFSALGALGDETGKLLRKFLFGRDALGTKIGALSGGERNRLQIARAVFLKANFLILDEPTNHLDIEGREAVEEGLADFEGTILAVSHDRWFVEKIAERIILVENFGFTAYEGSFEEYWRDLGAARSRSPGRSKLEDRGRVLGRNKESNGDAGATEAMAVDSPGGKGRGVGSAAIAAAAARSRDLERRIGAEEGRRSSLETESAKALASRDFAKAGKLAEEAAKTARLLEKLYEEWARVAS